jgi:hypothetical protein
MTADKPNSIDIEIVRSTKGDAPPTIAHDGAPDRS